MRHHNDETSWEQMLKDRDELERDVTLLKEQLRVADAAYNYWTQRCQELEAANERANQLIADEANKRTELQERLDEWKFIEECWGSDAHSIRRYIRKLRELCGEAEDVLDGLAYGDERTAEEADLIARLHSASQGNPL